MVNLFRYKYNWRSFLLFLCTLTISFKSFGVEINTGNVLDNSTFGTGTTYTTDNWTVSSGTHGHNYMAAGNGNSPGGSVAAEEDTEIKQTITLSEKTNMTTQEIQNGWSSTIGADIWYWNQYGNTTTLKQTITGSDGSVSTQQRVIQDTGCGSTNCGSFTNYTDTHTQGTNTQTDFDIEVSVTNTNNRTGHWGPDIDNVTLGLTYTYINPLDEGTQDVIDDIDTDIVDIIEDIPDDFDWYNDDIVIDDSTYTWEEDDYAWEDEYVLEDDFYEEYTMEEGLYFEEFEMEEFDIVQPPIFDDFETMPEMDFEEMPTIEEVFFEDDYTMEPPPMMIEEVFTEEFEEDFTSFIEETGLEEEFEQFLEEEGITAEEFFEEITEEEFSDELTEESFEEFEEPMEEIATNEESVPEVIEEKEEAMEEPKSTESEPIEEEKEVASNESTEESSPKEEEPSSESSEESEVQPEDSEEQDGVQPEGRDEVDTNDRVATDVAKVESKLKQNLKKIAKQIAKNTKETTQNLSKEDLFFKADNLDSYTEVAFYSAKDVYENTNMGFFLQMDLSPYTGDIYLNTNLNLYQENDPIEVNRVKLINLKTIKNKLLAELEALKQ